MRWLALMIFPAAAGCVSPVALDYQEDADFARYHTFVIQDADPVHSLDSRRVRSALLDELPAQGLAPADRHEQADLIVRHRFLEASDTDTTDVFWGLGAGSGGGGVGLGISTPIGVSERTEYTLVVEMVDRRRNEVVWQARSRRALEGDSPAARRSEWISTVVDDMLDQYPPGSNS